MIRQRFLCSVTCGHKQRGQGNLTSVGFRHFQQSVGIPSRRDAHAEARDYQFSELLREVIS